MLESVLCPECGCTLPSDSPAGPCPDCLRKRTPDRTVDEAGHHLAATTEFRHAFTAPAPAELARHFQERQRMDMVFTAGQYTQVSMLLNSFGVQLDEGQVLDPDLRGF